MMISFARAGPTRRTKRVVVATPSGTPSSTSGIQNWASLAAQRKSQASARPPPPPIAWPSRTSVTFSPMTRGPYHTRGRPRKRARLAEEAERGCRGRPAGEERRRRHAEVTRGDLGEERSEIRRHRQVARLEEPSARESRPATVDAAAAHGPSQRQPPGRVAVVGAAVAVLPAGAA